MTDSITVSVFGNKAILDNMAAWGAQVQAAAQAKLAQAGQMALDFDNGITPVLTGNLRSHNLLDVQEGVATVSNDCDYALPVLLGHRTSSGSFVPPRDWLTPGMDVAGKWLLQELKAF